MKYVIDTSAFVHLFKYYYPKRFPTLWKSFDELVSQNYIVSVKEAYREIQKRNDGVLEWANKHKDIFHQPSEQEAIFISKIFSVPHFQYLIEKKKLMTGGEVADPFVIAKAHSINATVVTLEGFDIKGNLKPNASKIPNICNHYKIKCVNIEQFMEIEGWKF